MLYGDPCSLCKDMLLGSEICDQDSGPICARCAKWAARKHFALQDGFEVSRARLEALFLRYALCPMSELRADPKRYASEVADLAFALTSASYQYLRLDELEAEHDAEMRAAKGAQ